MIRHDMTERPDYKEKADKAGFTFHLTEGERYWDETRAYSLTMDQIENHLEDPTTELYGMCLEAVEYIVNRPEIMTKMDIPADFHTAIRQSWLSQESWSIYGRFDFSYDGSVAKLLEFNADTPTSLFEASVFQWQWLQDLKGSGVLEKDDDQFNSIHEKLLGVFNDFQHEQDGPYIFHFACHLESDEDRGTTEYLADVAYQTGWEVFIMDIRDVHESDGNVFMDSDGNVIQNLFKLYPLEHMFREEFGPQLKTTDTRVVEPLWKAVLSNKGILPVLWELFPNHPNLLESHFDEDWNKPLPPGGWVKKPLLSREGQNVQIHDDAANISTASGGEYGEGKHIIQRSAILPKFVDDYTLIGSWVVGGQAAGISIREDKSVITQNLSRFVPHFIRG